MLPELRAGLRPYVPRGAEGQNYSRPGRRKIPRLLDFMGGAEPGASRVHGRCDCAVQADGRQRDRRCAENVFCHGQERVHPPQRDAAEHGRMASAGRGAAAYRIAEAHSENRAGLVAAHQGREKSRSASGLLCPQLQVDLLHAEQERNARARY